MTGRTAEGTAPCRVQLAGGAPGSVMATVAIDRRAWCRVETGVDGVLLESRDTLRRLSGRDVEEVLGSGILAPVARVLRAMGVVSGVRVVTQSRVPEGSGLGESAALGAAVAGAVAHALERDLDREEVARLASEAEAAGGSGDPAGVREAHTAVRGGALAFQPEAEGVRVESLAADPARIEESLLLIQGARSPTTGPGAADAIRAVASRFVLALREGRFEEVIGLWAEEWEARWGAGGLAPESVRVGDVVRGAGGGARVLGEGGILAVWAPPGARGPGKREAVSAAAKAAGLRLFPARVDLRGLEVE